MDKQYVERKLEVMRTTYEQNKEIAAGYAGPAVIDIFGEKTFVPQAKPEAVKLSEKQEELLVAMNGRAGLKETMIGIVIFQIKSNLKLKI